MAKNAFQSRKQLSNKIIFDIPASVDAGFSSALRTILVEYSTSSWEFWFGLLQKYKEEQGDARVHALYETPSKLKLGRWVSELRKRSSQLSESRVSRLNAIGFVWDANEAQWEQMFSELEHYKKENGDAPVSYTHLRAHET